MECVCICRLAAGGTVWHHGGEGKLAGYTSNKDITQQKGVKTTRPVSGAKKKHKDRDDSAELSVTTASKATSDIRNKHYEHNQQDDSLVTSTTPGSKYVKTLRPGSAAKLKTVDKFETEETIAKGVGIISGSNNGPISKSDEKSSSDKTTTERKVTSHQKPLSAGKRTQLGNVSQKKEKTTVSIAVENNEAASVPKIKDSVGTDAKNVKKDDYVCAKEVSSSSAVTKAKPVIREPAIRGGVNRAQPPGPAYSQYRKQATDTANAEKWAIKKPLLTEEKHVRAIRSKSALRREPTTLISQSLAAERAVQSADSKKRPKMSFDGKVLNNEIEASKEMAAGGRRNESTTTNDTLFTEMKGKVLEKMMKKIDVENRLKDFKLADKKDKEEINQASKEQSQKNSMAGVMKNDIDNKADCTNGVARTAMKGRDSRPSSRTGRRGSNSRSPKKESCVCDPEVVAWLQDLKLKDFDRYVKLFAEHEVDMDVLLLITEEQLKEMGIRAVGAYNKILIGLRDLRKKREEEAHQRSPTMDEDMEADSTARKGPFTAVQGTRASALRQTMLEARQKVDDNKRPWMNPNRNGAVRSRIDTGLGTGGGSQGRAEMETGKSRAESLRQGGKSEVRCRSRDDPPRQPAKPGIRPTNSRTGQYLSLI